MRRFAMILCLVALAVLPTTVLTQEAEGWVCPEGFAGQKLTVYNWGTYIADDTIPNFEAACGVEVDYQPTVGSSEEFLRLLTQPVGRTIDVMFPADLTVSQMIGRSLLEELDHSLIPNFANLSETFVAPPFDPENAYSIPYQWGTIGIGYNVTRVGTEITSWQQMFDYAGPVAWLEDPRSVIGIGLTILGYDANTENPSEIAAARDLLVANGSNVVYMAADDGDVYLASGDVDMTIEYMGDIFQVIADCECDDYAYAIPEEGAPVWVDNMVIPAGAPNVALAHAFIDYILDPQVSADISNYTAFASPNQKAIDEGLIDEELLNNPGIYPSEEDQQRLFFILEMPDAELDYNDAWDEIKILLGR